MKIYLLVAAIFIYTSCTKNKNRLGDTPAAVVSIPNANLHSIIVDSVIASDATEKQVILHVASSAPASTDIKIVFEKNAGLIPEGYVELLPGSYDAVQDCTIPAGHTSNNTSFRIFPASLENNKKYAL